MEHCENSDFKYKIYFASGQNYTFPQNDTLNIYNAVGKNNYIYNIQWKNIATFNKHVKRRK